MWFTQLCDLHQPSTNLACFHPEALLADQNLAARVHVSSRHPVISDIVTVVSKNDIQAQKSSVGKKRLSNSKRSEPQWTH